MVEVPVFPRLEVRKLCQSGKALRACRRQARQLQRDLLRSRLIEDYGAHFPWSLRHLVTGAPVIENTPFPLWVSFSYGEDILVAALSTVGPLGVDCELAARAMGRWRQLLPRLPYHVAQKIRHSASPGEDAACYLSYLEAVAKAHGRGLLWALGAKKAYGTHSHWVRYHHQHRIHVVMRATVQSSLD